MSPYLTTISQEYCKEEYVKDTDDFIDHLQEQNRKIQSVPKNKRPKYHLCTLDVKALYPSIRTDIATNALKKAFDSDVTTASNTKTALLELTELLFQKSYVMCNGSCYKPLIGIPTGGCNSRQNADCTLHDITDRVKGNIASWKFVQFFKRFIDDIFLLWTGSKRQFSQFVDALNKETRKYGIEFGDFSIGDSVDFLDTTVYLDAEGLIHHKLYRKPTDSRLYLKTHSFHSAHVFSGIAKSQMIRVKKRNSIPEQAEKDVDDLIEDLVKCGHKREDLNSLRVKLSQAVTAPSTPISSQPETTTTITAVVNQFQEVAKLRSLIKGMEPDISHLIGEQAKVLVATRKGPSIASRTVKNKSLCVAEETSAPTKSQKCGAKSCKSCRLLPCKGENWTVNGKIVSVPEHNLDCKTRSVIYAAQCSLCSIEHTYVGQTQQPFHKRANGHRGCFDVDDQEKIEKSALSLHAAENHPDKFNMDIFKFMILESVKPSQLNRRESIHIENLRTNVMGLNRMKVQK